MKVKPRCRPAQKHPSKHRHHDCKECVKESDVEHFNSRNTTNRQSWIQLPPYLHGHFPPSRPMRHAPSASQSRTPCIRMAAVAVTAAEKASRSKMDGGGNTGKRTVALSQISFIPGKNKCGSLVHASISLTAEAYKLCACRPTC